MRMRTTYPFVHLFIHSLSSSSTSSASSASSVWGKRTGPGLLRRAKGELSHSGFDKEEARGIVLLILLLLLLFFFSILKFVVNTT